MLTPREKTQDVEIGFFLRCSKHQPKERIFVLPWQRESLSLYKIGVPDSCVSFSLSVAWKSATLLLIWGTTPGTTGSLIKYNTFYTTLCYSLRGQYRFHLALAEICVIMVWYLAVMENRYLQKKKKKGQNKILSDYSEYPQNWIKSSSNGGRNSFKKHAGWKNARKQL